MRSGDRPNLLLPCSLSGAVMAFEGIRGATALVNGPSGCKFYVAALVDAQDLREDPLDLGRHLSPLYFGQPRVACTCLQQEEIIYGSEGRLRTALEQLRAQRPNDLIGIVNSCALSITGEDLQGICREHGRVALVETSGFTGDLAAGFGQAGRVLVREVMLPCAERRPNAINLIGPMIGQYNWRNDRQELKRMLGRLGIAVNAVLTAGATLEEIAQAPRASLNVVVGEEYGEEIVREMAARFGLPAVGMEGYSPYGIRNTTGWLRQIAEALGMDATGPLREEIEGITSRVYPYLARYLSGGTLKGLPVAIFADGSMVLALADFLAEYLGLDPVLLGWKTVGRGTEGLLQRFSQERRLEPRVLRRPDLEEIAQGLRETSPELILGSGFEQWAAREAGLAGVPFLRIASPIWDQLILSERPFLGYKGVLFWIEEILNALRERI
ncbi:MAG: nitrogenase component 1 [Candidatus Tectomicrobia bacterium]|uniref:Nitrogenase component 1 n=1 Tax=Tectimicrobiota bacterium TaxID=2528274 RepID=A0A932CMT0_UNCTE|nr:nitrogenase component 1 [Candidatus Tectomicrobia bacterium]